MEKIKVYILENFDSQYDAENFYNKIYDDNEMKSLKLDDWFLKKYDEKLKPGNYTVSNDFQSYDAAKMEYAINIIFFEEPNYMIKMIEDNKDNLTVNALINYKFNF